MYNFLLNFFLRTLYVFKETNTRLLKGCTVYDKMRKLYSVKRCFIKRESLLHLKKNLGKNARFKTLVFKFFFSDSFWFVFALYFHTNRFFCC